MIGGLIAKRFALALIQSFGNSLNLFIGDRCEVAAFREVLPVQAVGILVESAFPTMIRMRKVKLRCQGRRYRLVGRKLSAIIRR